MEDFTYIENIKEYILSGIENGVFAPDEYAKTTYICARRGILGEKISTVMSDGFHETDNTVTADEKTGLPGFIVTNPDDGEQYIITDSIFNEKYEAIPEKDGFFRPKGKPVIAMLCPEDISFNASWGLIRLRKNGYIVISAKDDIYAVQEDAFVKTYKSTGTAEDITAKTLELIRD